MVVPDIHEGRPGPCEPVALGTKWCTQNGLKMDHFNRCRVSGQKRGSHLVCSAWPEIIGIGSQTPWPLVDWVLRGSQSLSFVFRAILLFFLCASEPGGHVYHSYVLYNISATRSMKPCTNTVCAGCIFIMVCRNQPNILHVCPEKNSLINSRAPIRGQYLDQNSESNNQRMVVHLTGGHFEESQ